jgi:hypothetical protein
MGVLGVSCSMTVNQAAGMRDHGVGDVLEIDGPGSNFLRLVFLSRVNPVNYIGWP